MAFLVKLSSTTTQRDIAVTYRRLKITLSIAGLWLYLGHRYDLSLPRGLRAFVPSREFFIHMHAISCAYACYDMLRA